jgi:two-component system response regulator DesR
MERAHENLRVLVAEDNADLCAAVCALIDAEPDLRVVASIDRADQLFDGVRNHAADVVVLDLNLDGHSSVGPMQKVRRDLPQIAVVVYSGYDRSDVARALPMLGQCEYVSKTGDALELLDAIRRAYRAMQASGSP